MNVAAAATPSSPQKTSITTPLAASSAIAISNGRTMSEITQSSQPTGAGEPSASVCAGCGTQLQDTEVYACGCCLDLWLLADPNFDMTGESDG